MTDRAKPISFAKHFKIDKARLSELGVFNPILNFDTKLFVEPLLLKKSASPIIREYSLDVRVVNIELYRLGFDFFLTNHASPRRIISFVLEMNNH